MDEKQKLILVTGGARSGKSRFGEQLLAEEGKTVLYVATARTMDVEMENRVKKHQQQRPASWITLEAYRNFGSHLPAYQGSVEGVFLDCITLMVTQILLEECDEHWDSMLPERVDALEKIVQKEVDELLEVLRKFSVPSVIITNEVGLGIVPGDKMSRDFRDIAGRVNQRIAASAEEVYLVVAGIPVPIKQSL